MVISKPSTRLNLRVDFLPTCSETRFPIIASGGYKSSHCMAGSVAVGLYIQGEWALFHVLGIDGDDRRGWGRSATYMSCV
jgi:hypothetical protein